MLLRCDGDVVQHGERVMVVRGYPWWDFWPGEARYQAKPLRAVEVSISANLARYLQESSHLALGAWRVRKE